MTEVVTHDVIREYTSLKLAHAELAERFRAENEAEKASNNPCVVKRLRLQSQRTLLLARDVKEKMEALVNAADAGED